MLPDTDFQRVAEEGINKILRDAGVEILNREVVQVEPKPEDVPRMTHIKLETATLTVWLYDWDACIDDGQRKRVLEVHDYDTPKS